MSESILQTPPIVVIVPGNGDIETLDELRTINFYGWLEKGLQKELYNTKLLAMPDPLRAREIIWIPHISAAMEGHSEHVVLIGHSSGAAASLRFAEANRLRGLMIAAGYDNDLGDDLERESGYFSRPFDWKRISDNCGFIVQLAGARDSLVPIEIQRRVAGYLSPKVVYIEDPHGNHFFAPPRNPLIDLVLKYAPILSPFPDSAAGAAAAAASSEASNSVASATAVTTTKE